MNPADIANITSRLTKKPYITQEVCLSLPILASIGHFGYSATETAFQVVFGAGQQVTPALYTNTGDVQE
jgi:hypothetical protein